jgi:hypothetical protein
LRAVGYDPLGAFTIDAKSGVNKTFVWGMTMVKSFESVVGLTSQTFQNFYLAALLTNETLGTVEWAFDLLDRLVGNFHWIPRAVISSSDIIGVCPRALLKISGSINVFLGFHWFAR